MKRYLKLCLAAAAIISSTFSFAGNVETQNTPYPNIKFYNNDNQNYKVAVDAPGDTVDINIAPKGGEGPFINPVVGSDTILINNSARDLRLFNSAGKQISNGNLAITPVQWKDASKSGIEIKGTAPSESGLYTIEVYAENINDYYMKELPATAKPFIIKLQVGSPTSAPVIKNPIQPADATVDKDYQWTLSPSDYIQNADEVNFTGNNADQLRMTFQDYGLALFNDGDSSYFQGMPTKSGTISNIQVIATNTLANKSTTSDAFSLTVNPTENTPPSVCTSIPEQKGTEGKDFTFVMQDPAFSSVDCQGSPVVGASNIVIDSADATLLKDTYDLELVHNTNSQKWELVGTPKVATSSPITINFKAYNSSDLSTGVAGQFTVNIAAGQTKPVIDNDSLTATAYVGESYGYEISPRHVTGAETIAVAADSPTSEATLINDYGLKIVKTEGMWVLRGTPTQATTNPLTIKYLASNAAGSVEGIIVLTIKQGSDTNPPIIDANMPAFTATEQQDFKAEIAPAHVRNATTITMDQASVSILTAHNLFFGNDTPDAVNGVCQLNEGSCYIQGVPEGKLEATDLSFTAANANGTTDGKVNLTIKENAAQPPIVNPISDKSATVGDDVNIVLSNSTNTGAVQNANTIVLDNASTQALKDVGLHFGNDEGTCNMAEGACAITGTLAKQFTTNPMTIKFTAYNNSDQSKAGSFKFTTNAATPTAPVIANPYPTPPNATVDKSYHFGIGENDRVQNYTKIEITSGLTQLKTVGLGYNPETGVISGTPTQATTSPITINFKAYNGPDASSTGTFTLTIDANATPASPSIDAIPPQDAFGNQEFNFNFNEYVHGATTIALTGTSADDLQKVGLALGKVTDANGVVTGYVISGVPTNTEASTINVTFSASNSNPTATNGSFTINLHAPVDQPPSVSANIPDMSAQSGSTTFKVSLDDYVTGATSLTETSSVLAAHNLEIAKDVNNPGNWNVQVIPGKAVTGVLAKTEVTFDAKNGNSTAVPGKFNLTVTQSAPEPTQTSFTVNGKVGTAIDTDITPDFSPKADSYTNAPNPNPPTGYTKGLPAGVSFDTTTGVYSGTPTQAGKFSVIVTGTNSVGTGSPMVGNFSIESSVATLYCPLGANIPHTRGSTVQQNDSVGTAHTFTVGDVNPSASGTLYFRHGTVTSDGKLTCNYNAGAFQPAPDLVATTTVPAGTKFTSGLQICDATGDSNPNQKCTVTWGN